MAHVISLDALSTSRRAARNDAIAPFFKRGRHRHQQRGAFAPVVAVMAVPVLLGMFGLSYSVSDLLIARTQLQAATDSCALAAATQLAIGNTSPHPATVGLNFAQLNQVGIAHKQLSVTSSSCGAAANGASGTQLQVCFSSKLTDPFTDTLPTGSQRFARCQATQAGFLPTLISAVSPFSVTATSTAGIGYTEDLCIMPIAVCNPSAGQIEKGQVITGLWKNDNDTLNKFKWAKFDGDVNTNGNAARLKSYLQGNGSCPKVNFASLTNIKQEGGNVQAIQDEWNARVQSPTRKFMGAVIVNCSTSGGLLDTGNVSVKPLAYACMELLTSAVTGNGNGKGGADTPRMIYRGALSAPGIGCAANYGAAVSGSNQGQPIAALAR